MNPFEMVVLIVAIVAVANVLRARHGIRRGRHGEDVAVRDPDADRLREEIKTLKERVAVLERIATHPAAQLDDLLPHLWRHAPAG